MLDDDRDYEGYGNNAKKGLKKRDREREKRRDEGGETGTREREKERRKRAIGGGRRARPHAGISITRGTQSGMYVVTSGPVSCGGGGSSRFTLDRRRGDGKSRLPGSG